MALASRLLFFLLSLARSLFVANPVIRNHLFHKKTPPSLGSSELERGEGWSATNGAARTSRYLNNASIELGRPRARVSRFGIAVIAIYRGAGNA